MNRDEKIAEVRNLINQAMIDGVITESEVEKIFKKAQEYGVMDECEQLLENAQRKLKKQKAEDNHSSIMNKIKYGFIIGGVLFFIFIVNKGCFSVSDQISEEQKKYANIDDAIANYDFLAARKICGSEELYKNECLQKVIKAEITYYCANKAFEKAITSLTEYNFVTHYKEVDGMDSQWPYDEEANWFNNVLDVIVTKLALNGEKEKAINYLNVYAKGNAKYLRYEKGARYIFTLDYLWRDQRIKTIKQMK